MDSISYLIEKANQIFGFLIYVIFLMCLIRFIIPPVSGLGLRLKLAVLVFDLTISINKGIRLVFCILLSINNSVLFVFDLSIFLNPKFIIIQYS